MPFCTGSFLVFRKVYLYGILIFLLNREAGLLRCFLGNSDSQQVQGGKVHLNHGNTVTFA